jgi:hypothetical protein
LIKKQFFGFQETNPLIRFYFLLLILWPLGAAQAQDGGEIISALGMVEVLRDGRWQKAAVGETLNAGETVRTGADSRAALQLSSGSQLKLNARSQVQFKQIAPPSEGFLPTASQVLRSVLKVLNGEIWVRNSGEALDIETVPATATIRGTEFNLAVSPADAARLAVLDGLVEFSNPQGSVWWRPTNRPAPRWAKRRARRCCSIRSMRCNGRSTIPTSSVPQRNATRGTTRDPPSIGSRPRRTICCKRPSGCRPTSASIAR